jgi:hypothetical protein
MIRQHSGNTHPPRHDILGPQAYQDGILALLIPHFGRDRTVASIWSRLPR